MPDTEASCPDVSGWSAVRRGVLTAGPFADDALQASAATHEAKLWVASDRPGLDDAFVSVTGPDGRTVTLRRPGGESSISTAAQFWPGGVPLTGSGRYRIHVTVRADELCVVAHYTV